jgi:hypothetical protein
MGIAGFWKVGFPTRLTVDVKSGSELVEGQIEIQTFDGEGVPVKYQSDSWNVSLAPNSAMRVEAQAKHGRANRPIVVRIVNRNGKALFERQLEAEEIGTALPATQPWVVGIGSDELDLDQGSMKSTRGALSEISSSIITRVDQLPVSWNCYGGVDLLVVSSRNLEINTNIHSVQAIAIRDWIAQGGRTALSIGEHAESWLKTPEFAELFSGPFKSISRDCEPGPLESFVGSQSRLGNLNCALFTVNSGTIDLESKTRNREKFPLIARWAYGVGKVTFFAFELDAPELIAWESRAVILKNLLAEQWEKKEVRIEKKVYLGYDDLSGQLNSTLDHFPLLTLGNLASLTVLAGLFCLVIGPFDYFLISRSLRKPAATWLTLLFFSIGSCLFIAWVFQRWKPVMPSMNSMEFLEIDYQTQMLRGRSFSHCYGGERGAFDFSAQRNRTLTKEPTTKVQLDWFGQPGRGLGGFESTVATDRGMPTYTVKVEPGNNETIAVDPASLTTRDATSFGIHGVGIPAAGTKAMCAVWQERIELDPDTNNLTMILGKKDLLEGSFENPLDADLLDGLLIYCGRAYALDTRIRVGQRVTFSESTIPKDVTRRLQRRQNVNGEERSTPWNPTDTDKLERLMELISCHELAGGSKYTGLYSRYLSELDCSDVIRLDRAILLCELKEPALTWSVRRNAIPIQTTEGKRKTLLRLVIPIAKAKTLPLPSISTNLSSDSKQ